MARGLISQRSPSFSYFLFGGFQPDSLALRNYWAEICAHEWNMAATIRILFIVQMIYTILLYKRRAGSTGNQAT